MCKNIINDKYNNIENINSNKNCILELGCGEHRTIPHSITIDAIDFEDIDIVAKLPFVLSLIDDNTISEIHSHHFLEHIENLELLISECYRILKPKGLFLGTVPHFSNPYFYSDYTHLNSFGLYSFCYFSKNNYFKRTVPKFYNNNSFKTKELSLIFKSPFRFATLFKKIIQKIVNSNKNIQEFYEENLSWIFPAYEIKFKIEK